MESTLLSWLERLTTSGYHWWRRARLKIYFDPGHTYHVRTVLDHHNARGMFCHFMVRNDGKEPARECRARLMSVSRRTPNGEISEHDFTAPRVLKWAHEPDWKQRDIEPGRPGRRADLCYVVEGDPHLYFFCPPLTLGLQTVFPPGEYRVRVRVDSENGDSDEALYDISFDGTWSRVNVTPVPPVSPP